jgi:hypothetical protein
VRAQRVLSRLNKKILQIDAGEVSVFSMQMQGSDEPA